MELIDILHAIDHMDPAELRQVQTRLNIRTWLLNEPLELPYKKLCGSCQKVHTHTSKYRLGTDGGENTLIYFECDCKSTLTCRAKE